MLLSDARSLGYIKFLWLIENSAGISSFPRGLLYDRFPLREQQRILSEGSVISVQSENALGMLFSGSTFENNSVHDFSALGLSDHEQLTKGTRTPHGQFVLFMDD